ncbi:trigger factor [Candidatus Curculioniphilus buchneri]|uniref:trigger factor n=1 Tax=Candidatus Curculioniphilus buchneri TaxID=690594 RepID=UPI00376EA3ED
MHIDGFRRENIPINIIAQHYDSLICQNILRNLMQSNFITTVFQKEINLVGTLNYIP